MQIIERLRGFKSTISPCMIIGNSDNLKDWSYVYSIIKDGEVITHDGHIYRNIIGHQLMDSELVLSTRLTDETFRGIVNFQKATILETPIEEIQTALVS